MPDLVIEDGSIVAGANSYVTIDEYCSYAKARGKNIQPGDAANQSHLIRAMDYLESIWASYQGYRTDTSQALQWPRTGVCLYGEDLDANTIPQTLKEAQIELAIEAQERDLLPTFDRESDRLKAVEIFQGVMVEFQDSDDYASGQTQTVLTKARAKLGPLLNPTNRLIRA